MSSTKPHPDDELFCESLCNPLIGGLYPNPYYNSATCPDFINFSVCDPFGTVSKNFKSQMDYAEKVVPMQFASRLLGFPPFLPPTYAGPPVLTYPQFAGMAPSGLSAPARKTRRKPVKKTRKPVKKTRKTAKKTKKRKTRK